MNYIKDILDYIGFTGPLLISLITAISLFEKPNYLFSFIFGSLLNNKLNEILKLWIKERRPINSVDYLDNANIIGAHKYGMPSGHAQIISFAIIFLFLTKGPPTWLLLSIFIYFLTVYQRWSFRRHTLEQLFIGTAVGSIFGYIIFWITKRYLERL
jgi:membrane-associated phospholipid phosphatase